MHLHFIQFYETTCATTAVAPPVLLPLLTKGVPMTMMTRWMQSVSPTPKARRVLTAAIAAAILVAATAAVGKLTSGI